MKKYLFITILSFTTTLFSQTKWWMEEPIRFFQTNLPENYSTLDAEALVKGVADFGTNVLMFNMGGIAAQYPTEMDLHYRSRWLPDGQDLFGEVLEKAHAKDIRVIGRFDLSKTQKPVYDAHPEWFFKRVNGEPVIYNGLYSACINGDYYWKHAPTILTEALNKYPVDGVFFNMFGNPRTDYSGVPMGPCHCGACREKFRERYGRSLPNDDRDAEYREFLYKSSLEVAAMFSDLIHSLRPNAAFLTYIDEYTDVIIHESNTSVTRPLPLWPYSASDNVNRSFNSGSDKMVFNLCMSFIDHEWRFVHVPSHEVKLRLWQNLAHGAPPALVVLGKFDQEDKHSLVAGKPIFDWHKSHEDLYVGQKSAAKVLLLYSGGSPAYRGFFRILTEKHIPFAVSTDMDWLTDGRLNTYELVIAPDGAPPEVEVYVREGGRLLLAGTKEPPVEMGEIVTRHEHTAGCWRIHDHTFFPSLMLTNLIALDSDYAELRPLNKPLLTLIPPAMFGPPELVWLDKEETGVPGLIVAEHGKGRIAWLPWNPGRSYYYYSAEGHSGLIADLIDHLLPEGRQLRTDAHPLVEMTVMNQPVHNRTLIHLVNVSGHSSTGYFPPIPTGEIMIELDEDFSGAYAVKIGRDLPVKKNGRYSEFRLPSLNDYEVVVLKK